MKFCLKCGKEVETTIKDKKETIEVKDIPIEITSKVHYCNECGFELWDDQADNRNLLKAYTKYRKIKGLLSPAQIKKIRKKYGLSQKTFAKVLGLGEKTITRYENGSLPDMAQNYLIMLMDDPSNFKKIWDRKKAEVTDRELEDVEKRLEKFGHETTTRNKIRFMIEYKERDINATAGTGCSSSNIIYYPNDPILPINEVTKCK